MTKRAYTDYLEDIRKAALLACEFVQGIDFDAFEDNLEKQFAVIRALEIIGEAAAHLPAGIRVLRSNVAWEDVVGMRNVLIHRYFGVDARVIWETVHKDLPALRTTIEEMIDQLSPPDET